MFGSITSVISMRLQNINGESLPSLCVPPSVSPLLQPRICSLKVVYGGMVLRADCFVAELY